MEMPPKYAPPIVASTSTAALIRVPGGDGGMAVGTFTETITFCCAPAPTVNTAGVIVTQGATGAGPAPRAIVWTEPLGFRTGTTKVLERPWLV